MTSFHWPECVLVLSQWKLGLVFVLQLSSNYYYWLLIVMIGQRGFYCASPATWNSLPPLLKLTDMSMSLFSFRKLLKTLLFHCHTGTPIYINNIVWQLLCHHGAFGTFLQLISTFNFCWIIIITIVTIHAGDAAVYARCHWHAQFLIHINIHTYCLTRLFIHTYTRLGWWSKTDLNWTCQNCYIGTFHRPDIYNLPVAKPAASKYQKGTTEIWLATKKTQSSTDKKDQQWNKSNREIWWSYWKSP